MLIGYNLNSNDSKKFLCVKCKFITSDVLVESSKLFINHNSMVFLLLLICILNGPLYLTLKKYDMTQEINHVIHVISLGSIQKPSHCHLLIMLYIFSFLLLPYLCLKKFN